MDQSRRPHSNPTRASGEAVLQVLELRDKHPRWGARKLQAVLERRGLLDEVPSERTIARILERADAIPARRRRRARVSVPTERPVLDVEGPNDVWTIDFKGWWRTGAGDRIEPLTVRDAYSRYVLAARLLRDCRSSAVKEVLSGLFERHGLPCMMQMDNGSPFACTKARGGLTKLSAWLVSLGVQVVRSRPGCPQDNGGHERMHLDMRYELEDVPADSIEAQQEAIDIWRNEFNLIRPHEAIGLKPPGEVYRPSRRRYSGPTHPKYPAGWLVRKVDDKGVIRVLREKLFVSTALSGQYVGLRPLLEEGYRLYFHDVDLGQLAA